MYCRVCGADNADDARFCRVCGAELIGGFSAPPSEDDIDDTPTEILTGPDPGTSVFDDRKTVAFGSGSSMGQTGFLTDQTGYPQGQSGPIPGQTGMIPGQPGVPYRPPVNSKGGKKTTPWIYALVGVAALAVIAAVVIVILMNKKDKDSSATEVAGSTVVTTAETAKETTEEKTTKNTTEKTTEATTEEKVAEAHVTYRTYVQSKGWLEWEKDGKEAGTQGESKRIEAFQMKLEDLKHVDGGITYRAYVSEEGWLDWASNTEQAGKKGEGKSVEALEIKLTGEVADSFDVYYCVYAQGQGWLGWAKNGESAGTSGMGKRAESVKIELVSKKDGKVPEPMSDKKAFIEGQEETTEEAKESENKEMTQEEIVAMYKAYRDVLRSEQCIKDTGVTSALIDLTGDTYPELIYERKSEDSTERTDLLILTYAGSELKTIHKESFDSDFSHEYYIFGKQGDPALYQMWLETYENGDSVTFYKLEPTDKGEIVDKAIVYRDFEEGTAGFYDDEDKPIDEDAYKSATKEFFSGIDKVITYSGQIKQITIGEEEVIDLQQAECIGGTPDDLANYLSSFIAE